MSFTGKLFNGVMRIAGARRIVARMLANPPRHGGVTAAQFAPDIAVRSWQRDGQALVTLTRAADAHRDLPHVYCLHGGAYVLEGTPQHRRLLEALARGYPIRLTYIEYPLAPEHDVHTCHAAVRTGYRALLDDYPRDTPCLLGDSAGGGIALALLQFLRDQAARMPVRSALLSPWVDASMSHAQQREYARRDVLLDRASLIAAARAIARDEPLDGPLLAPLFQDQDGLGSVLLLFSDAEIFYPDCRELGARMQDAAGTHVTCVVAKDAPHDWALLPIPEARASIAQVGRFLQG